MDRELKGKVALVTGVTRRAGIGASIARELARAGARVFITFYRDYDQARPWGVEASEPETLLHELQAVSECSALELDLSAASAPRQLLESAVALFGRVDILVNNAAYWEPGGVATIDAPQLDRHYAINTRATVLLCAELARLEPAIERGRIINITSGQGHAAMPGELAYVVTKAALDALTITLATELAPRDITVNAVDPGPTDTGWLSVIEREELIRSSPSGKIAQPSDTARVVRLLAGESASAITGQIIRVQPGTPGPDSPRAFDGAAAPQPELQKLP